MDNGEERRSWQLLVAVELDSASRCGQAERGTLVLPGNSTSSSSPQGSVGGGVFWNTDSGIVEGRNDSQQLRPASFAKNIYAYTMDQVEVTVSGGEREGSLPR